MRLSPNYHGLLDASGSREFDRIGEAVGGDGVEAVADHLEAGRTPKRGIFTNDFPCRAIQLHKDVAVAQREQIGFTLKDARELSGNAPLLACLQIEGIHRSVGSSKQDAIANG